MKVLHLIDSLGLGGAQIVIKNLFEGQSENKSIHVYALREIEPHIEICHQNIHVYPSSAKYSFAPLSTLSQFIEEQKIDVLHCHLFRSQTTGWILKKFYQPHLKLIFHEHGPIFRNFAPWIIDQMLVLVLKISRKDVFRYIAISNATQQRLLERAKLQPEKIKIVSNAVNLQKYSPTNQVTHPKLIPFAKYGKFTIGYVGRLSTVKGCRYLIEAMSLLTFEAHLLIIGDGELFDELNTLVQTLNLEDRVHFLGYIDTPEQAYLLFNVLVVPSLKEAFGNIVIEAQSCGTPVIATAVAGPSEIITHKKNGLLCQTQSPKDLASKITLIYNDKTLQQQIVHSGLSNIKTYSIENFIKNINKIYNSN